jgi:hypothetical protein
MKEYITYNDIPAITRANTELVNHFRIKAENYNRDHTNTSALGAVFSLSTYFPNKSPLHDEKEKEYIEDSNQKTSLTKAHPNLEKALFYLIRGIAYNSIYLNEKAIDDYKEVFKCYLKETGTSKISYLAIVFIASYNVVFSHFKLSKFNDVIEATADFLNVAITMPDFLTDFTAEVYYYRLTAYLANADFVNVSSEIIKNYNLLSVNHLNSIVHLMFTKSVAQTAEIALRKDCPEKVFDLIERYLIKSATQTRSPQDKVFDLIEEYAISSVPQTRATLDSANITVYEKYVNLLAEKRNNKIAKPSSAIILNKLNTKSSNTTATVMTRSDAKKTLGAKVIEGESDLSFYAPWEDDKAVTAASTASASKLRP